MKTYNRELKKWVEEEKPVGSLKKPETCKGKKPHEFELVVPKYVETTHLFSREEVAQYYKISEDIAKFDNEQDEKARQLGVRHSSFIYTRVVHYYYKCQRCGKEQIK